MWPAAAFQNAQHCRKLVYGSVSNTRGLPPTMPCQRIVSSPSSSFFSSRRNSGYPCAPEYPVLRSQKYDRQSKTIRMPPYQTVFRPGSGAPEGAMTDLIRGMSNPP